MFRISFALFFLLPFSLFSEGVYTLHGFLRKSSSMQKMSSAFAKEGYTVRNWGYPSRDKGIEEHAEDLVEDLCLFTTAHPGETVHFVTHSLGGLIVRAALNHPNCPEEAKRGRAVLLAPPNQGARFGRHLGKWPLLPRLLGNKAGRELLTCEGFDHLGQFPKEMELLVISGTYGFNPLAGKENDGKVGFHESCLSTRHRHMRHLSGHSWMMYSEGIIKNAQSFIQEGSSAQASDTCSRRCGRCRRR